MSTDRLAKDTRVASKISAATLLALTLVLIVAGMQAPEQWRVPDLRAQQAAGQLQGFPRLACTVPPV